MRALTLACLLCAISWRTVVIAHTRGSRSLRPRAHMRFSHASRHASCVFRQTHSMKTVDGGVFS